MQQWPGMNYWHMQQPGSSPKDYAERKKANLKGYILCNSIHIPLWKLKNYRDEGHVSSCQVLGMGVGGWCGHKIIARGRLVWWNNFISWLWWWVHKATCVTKLHGAICICSCACRHTHTHTEMGACWNLNKIGGLCQCQFPGFDIVL